MSIQEFGLFLLGQHGKEALILRCSLHQIKPVTGQRYSPNRSKVCIRPSLPKASSRHTNKSQMKAFIQLLKSGFFKSIFPKPKQCNLCILLQELEIVFQHSYRKYRQFDGSLHRKIAIQQPCLLLVFVVCFEYILFVSGMDWCLKYKGSSEHNASPILQCWPTVSEADVGGMAPQLEVEPSHQHSTTFCDCAAHGSRGTV